MGAFDKLNDDANFDASGKITIAPLNGESGTSEPPAETAENTAASQPSPAEPTKATETPAAAEDKSGEGKEPAKATDDGTQPEKKVEPEDEETEDTLKTRFSKPTDTGDEWRMRAFREGQKLRKKLTPIQTQLDRINSPERVTRGLDFVHVFGEPDQPITEAVKKMTELSSSRTQELRDLIYNETLDSHPDVVARDLVEDDTVTVAELKEALQLKRSGAKPGQQDAQPQTKGNATVEVSKPEGMSDEDWEDFKIDYPEIYQTMQKQAAAKPAATPEKNDEPAGDPKLKDLETKVKTYEEREQEQALAARVAEIDSEGQKIHTEVFTVVTDRLRELGLEADTSKDDERTVKLKAKAQKAITEQVEAEFEGPNGPKGWEDWSLCTDEQKENRKLEAKIITLLAKGDFAAARDYIDVMKARVDLTLDRVVDQELGIYEAALRQPTEPTRNGKQHSRPEIIGGTTAGTPSSTSKTPWLDAGYRQEGESSFEAMNRYLQGSNGLPGR